MARGRGVSAENRSAAIRASRSTYLGKPCIHGHSGIRYSSCRMCVDCSNAKSAARRAATLPGSTAEYVADWRRRNPGKAYAASRRWIKKHPEKAAAVSRAHWHRRRARKQTASGSYTAEEMGDLLARQGGRCAYCGTTENLSHDHKIPLSRGGTNGIRNMQWLCVSDNSKKKDRTDSEYRAMIGLPDRTPWDAVDGP